ncbi:paraquat-inducible protein A [Bordetella flabilis]|uniref:Paraquat-inducible protein A n=1 Tax=Bordetella flabilis TaxID=463014 RepID=A0A193G8T9_9BORD|nr:paraquat-inducible protein A [Bordetella flabilis]ANN76402.1 paraquat-inducible protein A [Bordetella flabilis]
MTRAELIACHECDLLQYETVLRDGGIARCRRCNAELYRHRPDGINRALSFALTAIVLLAIANTFPILGLSVNGNLVQTTLFGAVRILYRDGMWPIAALVFFTTILTPLLEIYAVVYLLLPLRMGGAPRRPDVAFRVLHLARPWGMTEVLILGILVALVKLVHIATVVPGVALWAFGAAMVAIAAMAAAFDPRELWARIGAREGAAHGHGGGRGAALSSATTAAGAGLFVCHACGLLSKPAPHAHEGNCPRCGTRLHFRKPNSVGRTWALLVAAIVLYVPANVLPVMDTSSLFGAQEDTIMSGVVYLWTSGSWPLAVLVFIASIAVPLLKILALVFLVAAAQRRSRRIPAHRARIYRIVELVGRWSMLDIYVITVLVALVQFSALATIKAGPAAIAFGAVVVLTMAAAKSFDPRLIWDSTEKRHG